MLIEPDDFSFLGISNTRDDRFQTLKYVEGNDVITPVHNITIDNVT